MARIRSIKPEFWTDGLMVKLPMHARLFYVGLWNFADDWGVLEDDPESLKLRVMPADDIDAVATVELLVEKGRLKRATTPDGSRVLVIHRWQEHQRIDKRAAGRWGDPAEFHYIPTNPAESPPIPTTPDEFSAGRERKGVEGKGKEIDVQVASPPCDPVAVIFTAWQEATRHHKAVLSPQRRQLIVRARKHYPDEDLCDACRGIALVPHNNGATNGTRYDDIELALRDSAHIERFRDTYRGQGARGDPRMDPHLGGLMQSITEAIDVP